METPEEKVDHLKKVTLLLQSGTSADEMDLTPEPVINTFIFGTGSDGITSFEYDLVNKSCNDEIVVNIDQNEILSKFGHLTQFIMENIETRDSFYLKVKITNISSPENREIVEALAGNVKHGGSCDCGCGCG